MIKRATAIDNVLNELGVRHTNLVNRDPQSKLRPVAKSTPISVCMEPQGNLNAAIVGPKPVKLMRRKKTDALVPEQPITPQRPSSETTEAGGREKPKECQPQRATNASTKTKQNPLRAPIEAKGDSLTPTSTPQDQNNLACSKTTMPVYSDPLIQEVIQLWRMRQRWHRAEKSLTMQGRAVCRSWTEGDKDKANKLYDDILKSKDFDGHLGAALLPFVSAVSVFTPQRVAIENRLKNLITELPAWPWAKNIKGFGPLNFAAIVGEAGDIASYKSPAALWKRFGMAVINGGRQRKIADTEQALLHGYNPSRRAVAYLLGDTLIKANKTTYRKIYLDRKAYEAGREEVKTAGHAHNRAARYMVKRVLKDLWVECRKRATDPLETTLPTPDSEIIESKQPKRVVSPKKLKNKQAKIGTISDEPTPASEKTTLPLETVFGNSSLKNSRKKKTNGITESIATLSS